MNIERPSSKQPIPENAKRVFKGVIFDVYQWEQEMFDGTKKTFEKLKRPDTVSIFPILPDGKILLIEENQPAADLTYVGPCGGRVDGGEDILSAAKRELLEETGYEAEEYILWDSEHPVGKIDWVVYTFIAKGLKKIAEPHLDGGEKIKLVEVSFEELIQIAMEENTHIDETISLKFFAAELDPQKKKELKEIFKPSENK